MDRFTHFTPSMPFDPAAYRDRLPKDATTRGMFFHTIEKALAARGCDPLDGKWVAFKRYPIADYHAAMLEAASRICPNGTVAQGLFEIGRSVYPNFADSMVGRAIYVVVEMDVERLIQLSPRAYAAANSHGECVVHSTTSNSGHWSLVGLWIFHPFSLGVSHGALTTVGATNIDLRYVVHEPEQIEFRVTWDAPDNTSEPNPSANFFGAAPRKL